MARPLRLQYPHALYHLVARGNQDAPVFRDDQDRAGFLETLAEACGKTGWRVHAYVIMANHYHLVVQTPAANLVVGMKWLQGTYTRRFNLRHKLHGHLFQGRYKALMVDHEVLSHFGLLATYVHLNPVRSGLIRIGQQPLRSYRWSSHPEFLKDRSERPAWLEAGKVIESLVPGVDDPPHRRVYESYMEARVLACGSPLQRKELDEGWKPIRRGWYLGGKAFQQRLALAAGAVMRGHQRASYQGGARAAQEVLETEALLGDGLKSLGLSLQELRRLPFGAPAKLVLAWWLRRRATASRRWISDRLVMGDDSRVTQASRRVNAGNEPELEAARRLLTGAEEAKVPLPPQHQTEDEAVGVPTAAQPSFNASGAGLDFSGEHGEFLD